MPDTMQIMTYPPSPGEPSAALSASREGRVDEALAACETARKGNSPGPAAWLDAAAALASLDRHTEADALLGEASAKFPDDADTLLAYARLADRRGDWAAALWRYGVLRDRVPNSIRGFLGAAATLSRLGHRSEADAVLTQASEKFPGTPEPCLELARLAAADGDHAAALPRYADCLARFPDLVQAAIGQIVALRELGRLEDAEQAATVACQRFPNDPYPLLERQRNAERRNDWDKTLLWSAMLGMRFPEMPLGYAGMAVALRNMGLLDDAEALLASALPRFPRDPWIAHVRADLALERGDPAEAVRRFAHAVGCNPDGIDVILGFAESYRRNGDPRQGIEVLDKALTTWPGDHRLLAAKNLIGRATPSLAPPAEPAPPPAPPAPDTVAATPSFTQLISVWTPLEPAAAPVLPEGVSVSEGIALVAGLAERGDDARAATALGELVRSHDGHAHLVPHIVSMALRSRDLNWLRRLWPALLHARHREPERLAYAVYDLYGSFYAEPDSDFLVRWVIEQAPSTRAVGWMPTAVWTVQWLLSQSTKYPGIERHFTAIYAAVPKRLIHPVVRALLGPYAGDMPTLDEYVGLVERILRGTTENEWASDVYLRILAMLRNKKGDVIGAVRTATEDLVRSGEFLRPGHEAGLLLLLMSADLLSPEIRDSIVTSLRSNSDWLTHDASLAKPGGILRNILNKTSGNGQATVGARRPLRIALEVSGQLRGFRQARLSWPNLGTSAHETHVAVHCWNKIGGIALTPGRPTSFRRNFSPRLAATVEAIVIERGLPFLEREYGGFLSVLRDATTVTEQDIKEFYGTEAVAVDDQETPRFSGRSNVWWMSYSINRAHELAVAKLPECDLYVRMRPDYEFREPLNIDWWDLFARSRQDRIIFADRGRYLDSAFLMGDQFAVGTREIMDVYAETINDADRARQGAIFGYPHQLGNHTCVALSTFCEGIAVEVLREIGTDSLLNPPVPSAQIFYDALMGFIGMNARHEFDVRLLEAVTADRRSEEAGNC